MNIIEGDSFFANEATINFSPTHFNLDFKNVTPRTDPRSKKGQNFVLKHNVITVDPWHAKQLAKLLPGIIQQYEDNYGKIDKPKAIKAAEKKVKSSKKRKKKKKLTEERVDIPSYLG